MNIPTQCQVSLGHKLKPGAKVGKHEFIWSRKAVECIQDLAYASLMIYVCVYGME